MSDQGENRGTSPPAASVKSTAVSMATAHSRAQADHAAKRDELEDLLQQRKGVHQDEEDKIAAAKDDLDAIKERLNNAKMEGNVELTRELEAQVPDAERAFRALKRNADKAKRDAEREIASINRKLNLLQLELDCKLSEIADEFEAKKSGSTRSPTSKVQSWVDKSSPGKEDPEERSLPESEELQRRLDALMGKEAENQETAFMDGGKCDNPQGKFGMDLRPPQDTIPTGTSAFLNPNPQTTDPVSALLSVFTSYLQHQQSKPNTTEKFIARQSSAKELPSFDGTAEDWPAFSADFKRTTEVCQFSGAENLSRLRKSLKGKALDAVKSLMISPDNVGLVMETLKIRFGQTEHILRALLRKAVDCPSVNENKIATLVEFDQRVQNFVAIVQAEKMKEQLQNPMMLDDLERKLPVPYLMEWRTKVAEGIFEKNVKCFAIWLHGKAVIAAQLCPPVDEKDTTKKEERKPFAKKEKVFATDSKDRERDKCPLCQESHRVFQCEAFKNKPVSARRELAKTLRLCFNCLSGGHPAAKCPSKKTCRSCQGSHKTLLHEDRKEEGTSVEAVHHTGIQDSATQLKGILGLVEVTVRGPKGLHRGYGLVDPGSTVSLIDAGVSKKIGIKGKEQELCIQGIENASSSHKSELVAVSISSAATNIPFRMDGVRTLSGLNLGPFNMNAEELKKQYPHLRGLPLQSLKDEKPFLLIGAAHSSLTIPQKLVRNKHDEPMAYKSKLGWYVSGACRQTRGREIVYHVCETKEGSDQELHELVKQHFRVEDLGVKLLKQPRRSAEDERALAILKETTRKADVDRYETGLIWQSDGITLPDSKLQALNRLYCQERKMDKDPAFATAYVGKMKEYLDKGFIAKVSPHELTVKHDREWYLPHFGVLNPNKPGKLRLVFDAAAQSHGMSLNKALLPGPDLNNSIVDVLLKFRQFEVAFAGDVQDMYHRVFIRPEDRPAQRFLWRGMDRDRKPDVYEMVVMTFGSSSSPTSAQYVKNEHAQYFKRKWPKATEAVQKKFYVDDYLDSTATTEEAIERIDQVYTILHTASFKLCNFVSNSKEVLQTIPAERRAKDMQDLNLCHSEEATGRVLGIWWNYKEDLFTYRVGFHKVPKSLFEGEDRPTKRQILSTVMSIFDPLGFVAPLVIRGRILLQLTWRAGLGFDEEVTDRINTKWLSLLGEIGNMKEVKVPRCYSTGIPTAKTIELHLFCDGSEQAYSAVGYLRISRGDKNWDISIVMARCRVAPLCPLSIPRMELQGAVMAVRIGKHIKETLKIPINKAVYWSDSTTVLNWIKSDARRFQQFVAVRLGEILECSDPSEWRHVPTKMNPADEATRDSNKIDLSPESKWFRGPQFLHEGEEEWPKAVAVPGVGPDDDELKPSERVFVVVEKNWGETMDFGGFSKYEVALKTVAKLQRIPKRETKIGDPITAEELKTAEMTALKLSQAQSFIDELNLLHGGKQITTQSKLGRIPVYLKDGIIYMRSRIHDPTEPEGGLILLDAKNPLTRLIILQQHRFCLHQGKETVAAQLRRRFWILGLKPAIKKIASECVLCRLLKGQPSSPVMAQLPDFRQMSHVQPFTNCGLDYFGPFFVKTGRRREKRWGALFTCLSTRAIHLEIAGSLSTDSAIMAIHRFANRRGTPNKIYCDNGTNFHGANNEMNKFLKEHEAEVKERMARFGIDFVFNPPASPHMGGVWERLVRSVKTALAASLGQREVSEEVMLTFLTEVESVLNNRPLTEVSVDPADPSPITPNHFLLQWRSGTEGRPKPDLMGEYEDCDLYLRKQWKVAQRLADHFWNRWRNEYLPTIAKTSKWTRSARPLEVGDRVIIVDDQAPRNSWPAGHITETFPGKDGVVRVVLVKTDSGEYRRAARKVIPLGIKTDTEMTSSFGGKDVAEEEE